MRTAVIGIGSNSLRMLVADIHQGRLKRLKRYREGLRVFAALEANGAISRDMTQRACESVGRFRARAMEDGAGEVRLFATSAVRDAVNRQAFCDALRDSTGLTADVLSGEQEARLSFLGATESTDRGLIDIGGGSTEIVSGRGDHIDAAISLQLGAVRLFRAMPILTVQDARRVEAFARDKVREGLTPEHAHASASGGWVGVGGTFTTTAALVQRIPWDQRELIHGFALGREALEQAIDFLAPMPVASRTALSCMQPQRADIVVHGMVILLACMKELSLDSIRVSEYGNLEGYLKALYFGRHAENHAFCR